MQNTAKRPRFLWQEKCVRSRVHFEHHSVAQRFDNILTVEWHNYQQMHCSATGQKSARLRDKLWHPALLSGHGDLFYLDFLYSVFLFSVRFFLYSLSTQQGFQSCTFWGEPILFQRQINFWKTKHTDCMCLLRQLTSRTELTSRRMTDLQACFFLEGEFFKIFF